MPLSYSFDNQIKSNQIKSNQIKSNKIKSFISAKTSLQSKILVKYITWTKRKKTIRSMQTQKARAVLAERNF